MVAGSGIAETLKVNVHEHYLLTLAYSHGGRIIDFFEYTVVKIYLTYYMLF